MEIEHPRRILLLAPEGISSDAVLSALTRSGRTASPASASATSDLIHQIATSYYKANIPIWKDAIASTEEWIRQWQAEDGASDVVQAIGAWIVCFTKPVTEDEKVSTSALLNGVSSVITHHLSTGGYDGLPEEDVVLAAIALPSSQVQSAPGPVQAPVTATATTATTAMSPALDSSSSFSSFSSSSTAATADTTANTAGATDALTSTLAAGHDSADAELEDLCRDAGGWEYIDGAVPVGARRRNEYGEPVGLDRLLDALKAGEWDSGGGGDGGGGGGDFGHFGDFELGEDDDDDGDDGDGEAFTRDLAQRFGGGGDGGGTTADMRQSLLGAAAVGAGTTSAGVDGDDDDDEEAWRVRGHQARSERNEGQEGMEEEEEKEEAEEGDEDVQQLQNMMLRLQAARDMGADLPAAERRRLANRAVSEVMRGL